MAFDPTTATLDTKETTSSGGFDPSTAKPDDIKTTSFGAGLASAAEAVAATPGVLAGARAAMAVTPPVLPIVGPFAKPIMGIAGGVAGGMLASVGINSLEQLSDSVFGTNIEATRKKQRQEHPVATTVGGVAGGSLNPWMRPGIPSTLSQAAFGGGVMAVVGGAQRAAHGEKVFDPTAMAIDVGTGIFTKPTAMGERMLGHKAPTGTPGTDPNKPKIPDEYKRPEYRAKELVANIPKEHQRGEEVSGFPTTDKDIVDFARLVSRDDHEKQKAANPEEYLKQKQELDARYGEGFADKIENKEFYRELVNKQLPPKPPKKQKEELDAWMEKAKQVSAERDSTSPLTEAAIRNKETGQVERHGPKHDQDRKEATKATHEEGFVTERGTFLTREQAVDHAKRTGQIPEDHVLENPPGEQPGLHSGDLRTAGDERFQITDSQPAGVAKPEKPLLTRADHIERIEQLEYSLSIDESMTENTAHTLTPEQLAKENKYLVDQQTKIDNLRKSIPEPVVKDKANLTAEETHDILVGAKTVGEGLQRIVDGKYGNKLERWLARKLLSMESVRSATLNINTKDVGLAPSEVGITAGEYHPDHSVHMYSTGELQVFLHESIHAATSRLLFEGKHAAAKALNKLYEHAFKTASPEYYKAWKDGILTNEEAFNKYEQKQKALGKESHYGLRNVHEFLTETFTQDSFRNNFLKGMSDVQGIKSGSAWEGFKKIIHEMLGATKPQETAFIDQILEQGSKLMDSKSKTVLGGGQGTGAPSRLASRLSQEVHDQLEREGIPVAHTSSARFALFDWVKNALSGEGAMVKGAGTYLSQKDSTNRFYVEAAKHRAIEEYLNNNRQVSEKGDMLSEAVDDANTRVIDAIDEANSFKDDELARAEYDATRTYKSFVDEINATPNRAEANPNNPEIRKQYDAFIDNAKQIYKYALEHEAKLKDEVKKAFDAEDKASKEWSAFKVDIEKKVTVPTYHMTLEAKPEELLDWDAHKQSGKVRGAFKNLGIEDDRLILKPKKGGSINQGGEGDYLDQHGNEITIREIDEFGRWDLVALDLDSNILGQGNTLKELLESLADGSKTGKNLYDELSKKFEPQGADRGYMTDENAKRVGDAKASIALAEQGVVGNVHNAAGGRESTFRNYVAFDDSRLTQNLVTFASKGKGKDATAAPPVVDVTRDKVDRTKTDPRDVPNEKELLEIAADIYDKHGQVETTEFFKGYQEYKKTWLEPVAETEKFVGMNLRNKAANERIIYNEKEKMLKGITDPERRVAVAEAVDRGDLSGLSAEEVAVANRYSELVADIGERAVEKGVVKGLLEDYVTHVLEWAGAPKGAREEFLNSMFGKGSGDPSMHGMDVSSKFAKERKFKTFADLELYLKDFNKRIAESGKSEWRLKLKTKDIAEIYKEYALSMEKAIENKSLVDNLKQVRNAAGETLIKEVNKDNPLPHGWKMMDSPQFAGYAVHPDMAPALKFVFDAGPGKLMGALGWISQVTKRMNVIGSFFHAKSLMEVISSTGIPIWTPLKEAIVLPLVEKTGKALFGKDVQLSAISKALEQYRKGGVGEGADKWIREDGLVLEMPEDVSKGILTEAGKFADSMIGKYGPKTRVLEKSLSTVEKYTLGLFDKFTWDYLHTGGKLMVADAFLDKARMTAAKEGKPFDEATQRKEIAKFVNDSFGGLNWFDAATQTRTKMGKEIAMATYSPEGRRGLQLALFAPDWTISTVRAFSAALPKELNPTKWHPVEGIKGMMTPTTKADYARLYQFKTALTYFTLLNAINMMTANRPIWENKDPTRIEWPDGTSMQAMKHAMEPYHWIMDSDKTLSNKLGFIPKAAIVGIAGTEYASPMAQKLVDPSAAGRLKAVAGMALPFQVSAAKTAPEGEGAKRAVLGTLGFPIYGATKEQKKEARAEREKLLKKAAKDYRDKAKERGWEQ